MEYIRNEFGHCGYEIVEDYAHIYDLFIKPYYRGRGKARELLMLAIGELRKLGWNDKIKIVAKPTEKGIDKNRLKLFYQSLDLEVYNCYGNG